MNHGAIFLDALAQNEDDTPTRMIYADWLEEHGEYEEADRQRQWPAAKAWLVGFCQQYNPTDEMIAEDPSYKEDVTSYASLIECGRQALKEESDGQYYLNCGRNEDMCDDLRNSHSREFWRNWSVVTGVPLPENLEDRVHFHCAC